MNTFEWILLVVVILFLKRFITKSIKIRRQKGPIHHELAKIGVLTLIAIAIVFELYTSLFVLAPIVVLLIILMKTKDKVTN